MTGQRPAPAFRLGIIGGLGPLASADFYEKITQLTSAGSDQAHIPLVILSIPETPDRSAAIFGRGASPFSALRDAVRILDEMAVELVVITCNTAHHWYDQLETVTRARILHIADCAVAALDRDNSGRRVVVFATRGTIHSGFYQRRLVKAGYLPVIPDAGLQTCVDTIIAATKQGDIASAASLCALAQRQLEDLRADAVLLACTELPLAWDASLRGPAATLLSIDVNAELARESIRQLGYPLISKVPATLQQTPMCQPPVTRRAP